MNNEKEEKREEIYKRLVPIAIGGGLLAIGFFAGKSVGTEQIAKVFVQAATMAK